MNGHGDVVGYYWNPGPPNPQGFIYTLGSFVPFDVPGALYTWAAGINNNGQIVGLWEDTAFVVHGFFYNTDGTLTFIDYPGATDTEAFSINDDTEIVGWFDPSTSVQGFSATPPH